MGTSIFKAYDVRGIYKEEIDEKIVRVIGRAGAHMFASGKVLIAHDIRNGSESFARALEEGFKEEAEKLHKKFEVIQIGLSTSPMFYFLVNDMAAA